MTPEELETHMSPEEPEEEEEVYKKIFDWKTLLTDQEKEVIQCQNQTKMILSS